MARKQEPSFHPVFPRTELSCPRLVLTPRSLLDGLTPTRVLPTRQNQARDPNRPHEMQSWGFCWTSEKETLSAGAVWQVGSRAAGGHLRHHTGRLPENKANAKPSHRLRPVFNDIVRSPGSRYWTLNPRRVKLCDLITSRLYLFFLEFKWF